MMITDKVKIAIAIIHQDGKFLMQLRDDLPNIIFPGYWGFFGGHFDPGETADQAIRRELTEEIGHIPTELTLFERSEDEKVIRYFYQAELNVPMTALELNEGQDMGLCSILDIQRGYKYSLKLQEDRPLGAPHQQILLKFLARKQQNIDD